MQPVQPLQPDQPVQVVQPVQPVKLVEPLQPVQPFQPVQVVQPGQPVQPVQSVQPVLTRCNPLLRRHNRKCTDSCWLKKIYNKSCLIFSSYSTHIKSGTHCLFRNQASDFVTFRKPLLCATKSVTQSPGWLCTARMTLERSMSSRRLKAVKGAGGEKF